MSPGAYMYAVAKSHCMLPLTAHESNLLTHLSTLIAPTNFFFPHPCVITVLHIKTIIFAAW